MMADIDNRSGSVPIPKHALVNRGLFISIVSSVSKVLGMVREMVLAYFFGTSNVVDAYRVAMSAVFLPLHIFGGFALNDSFIPTFKSLWVQGKKRLAWLLFNQVAVFLVGISIFIMLLELFFTHEWIRFLAPGFDEERYRLTVELTRWIALVMPVYVLGSLFVILLNCFYVFRTPSLRPVIQNIFLLVGIVFAVQKESIIPLGLAYPLSSCFFILIIFPLFIVRYQFCWTHHWTRMKKLWSHYGVVFLPLICIVFIQRINYIADRFISSYFEVGSIASLEYSRFIIETPTMTLGLGLIQVILPYYSDLNATGQRDILFQNVQTILSLSLMMILPLSVFLWIESNDIIKVIFGYGAFQETSISVTALTLRGFVIGLWALFSTYYLQRVYNAQKRNIELLLFSLLALTLNIILNIYLGRILGIQGIAIATSLSYILYYILLSTFFDKKMIPALLKFMTLMFIGALLLLVIIYLVCSKIENMFFRLGICFFMSVVGWGIWSMAFPQSRLLLKKVWNQFNQLNARKREKEVL